LLNGSYKHQELERNYSARKQHWNESSTAIVHHHFAEQLSEPGWRWIWNVAFARAAGKRAQVDVMCFRRHDHTSIVGRTGRFVTASLAVTTTIMDVATRNATFSAR
jgi:hypothetical protein